MDHETAASIRQLIQQQRWAALATLDANGPLASMACYAVEPASGGLALHLSQLAQHTRNMLEDPRVSLIISEPDDGREDPQTLARLSIQGRVVALERDTDDYNRAGQIYQARFPASAQRFGFADFVLFRLTPHEVRIVGGFARAYTLSSDEFRQLLQEG
ncbi:MAG: hypothetical protein FD165_427 [Gammaproteobacteria bacterium]|nr:MAG: hypothetical protein FD165_427 [Gammaproteobacteria bacterium]TND04754.1 MAG: hypothetical protein FD120_1321 [Gammaproteobacteria bacterium]